MVSRWKDDSSSHPSKRMDFSGWREKDLRRDSASSWDGGDGKALDKVEKKTPLSELGMEVRVLIRVGSRDADWFRLEAGLVLCWRSSEMILGLDLVVQNPCQGPGSFV